MTVTFGVTVTGVAADGGGTAAAVNNSGGRRVLAAKTDSVSNVNNNNNNINNINNNNHIHSNNNNNNSNVHNNNYIGPAGTPSITGKASVLSVRRVLFGPPADPAETRAWLDRQLCAAAASDTRAWNFDFLNERPLRDSPTDRYLWERVCLPAQQQQQQQADQRDCGRTAGVQRTRQSKVTDFMNQAKKRPSNAIMIASAGSLRSNKRVGDESPANNNNKRARRSIVATMAI